MLNKTIKKGSAAKSNLVVDKKIQPEKYFWLCDGQNLKSLKELAVAMGKMSDGVFNHHVTKERNDFVAWVKGVFNEEKLAIELNKAKTAKEAAKTLKDHGF